MTELIAQYGILIVALIIFAGEIGLPTLVPGEIALLFAGSQVIHSLPMLIGAIALFGAIDLVATTTIHTISRTGGNRLLCKVLHMSPQCETKPEVRIERWRSRLGGYDPAVVFVTRMIPMFRLYASITTGLIRIRFRDFLLGAAPAAWIWATTPLTVGYLLRTRISGVVAQYPSLMRYVIVGSVSITLGLAFTGWLRHAGSREAALRRVRFTLGLAAAGGAAARIVMYILGGPGLAGHHYVASALVPVVASWMAIIGVFGFGFLWVAAHDLRIIIAARHHRPGFTMASGMAWISMVAILTGVTAWTSVTYPAL
ncbi:MAG: DedA family protein [Chloroflexota bacterium]